MFEILKKVYALVPEPAVIRAAMKQHDFSQYDAKQRKAAREAALTELENFMLVAGSFMEMKSTKAEQSAENRQRFERERVEAERERFLNYTERAAARFWLSIGAALAVRPRGGGALEAVDCNYERTDGSELVLINGRITDHAVVVATPDIMKKLNLPRTLTWLRDGMEHRVYHTENRGVGQFIGNLFKVYAGPVTSSSEKHNVNVSNNGWVVGPSAAIEPGATNLPSLPTDFADTIAAASPSSVHYFERLLLGD